MRTSRSAVVVLLCILTGIILTSGVLFLQAVHAITPTQQVLNSWQTIKLSGEYDITSTVDQYTSLSPSLENIGMHERHQRFRIDGHINESQQSSSLRITNELDDTVVLEIRRERGQTYTLQGNKWIAVTSNQLSQLDTLSLLAGISDVTQRNAQQRIYAFTFDGNMFATQMQQALEADRKHGIVRDAQWQDVSANEQFRTGTGVGNIQIDADGLPRNMQLELEFPATQNMQASRSTISTTYTNYVRTGLALKRAMNQPMAVLAEYLGLTKADFTGLYIGLFVVCMVLFGILVAHWFGRRLYLPLTIVVVGMLLYQPFSSIPRASAATSNPDPPSGTTTDTPSPSPTVVFTPFESFATQGFGLALPKSGTASNTTSTFTTQTLTRTGTTTSTADDDKDGLTNSEEDAFHSNPRVSDTDNDGLDDKTEYLLGTDPQNTDTDADGLSDFAETQIGTFPRHADSDADGIPDYVEVTFPSTYGTALQLYSNPIEADTNRDGLLDGAECPSRVGSITSIPTSAPTCPDTDNDGMPDFLDPDNDNDAVMDAVDLASQTYMTHTGQDLHALFNETDYYPLKVQNIPPSTTVRPILVDLQFRPVNSSDPNDTQIMYLDNSIYDWPNNDKLGQIQRTNDSTFSGSTYGTDEHSLKGDMRINGSLEVRIPIGTSNYGGLPAKSCAPQSCGTPQATDVRPLWLNYDKLQQYGISAAYTHTTTGITNTNELALTVPIYPVEDPSNGSIVAYNSTLYYESNGQNWLDNHQVRLQWVVSSIQNNCPATSDSSPCLDSARIETVRIVQTYYGSWMLTGANVTDYVTPYDTAIITENTALPAISANDKRRKDAVVSFAKLDEIFLSNPLWSVNDPVNQSTSIVHRFDSKNNASIRTNTLGLELANFTANYRQYGSDIEQIRLATVDIPNILDANICAAFRVTTCDTTTISQLKQQCVTRENPADEIRCMPSVIIASSKTQRTNTLTSSGLSLADTDPLQFRSLVGRIFKVDRAAKAQPSDPDVYVWRALSQSELSDEVERIISYGDTTSTQPTNDTINALYVKYAKSIKSMMIALFATPNVHTFTPGELIQARKDLTSDLFGDSVANTWGDVVLDFVTTYNSLLNLGDDDEEDNTPTVADQTEWGIETSQGITDLIRNVLDVRKDFATLTKIQVSINGVGMLVAVTNMLVMGIGIFGKNSTILDNKRVIKITFAAADLTIKALDMIDKIVEAVRSVETAQNISKFVNSTFKTIRETFNEMKFINKALTVVGVVIGVGLAATTMAFAIKEAKFGWQIGNAVASFIGEIVALVLLTALSLAGPIGALISAIIGVIDAIATLVCAKISEKAQRSSAGQWLCGGITGLIANFFTWYKSSLVVDPNDQYSRNLSIEPTNDIGLQRTTAGFVRNNQWVMKLSVTDKIEKMPFPATWMALPWFWQWLNQDERDVDFRYQLSPNQVDLRGQLSLGSRRSTFQSISDPDFSWQLQQYVQYNSALTRTGINQKLSDLWLSKAWKSDKQTCFVIWIFALFFVFPIPICYIDDQSDAEYLNINESNQTVFDVFPPTIEEFITMRKNGSAYTFAWSSPSDTPAFPNFLDADNDGLNASTEAQNQTYDNNWDSDSDGISDQSEVLLGSSPNARDTDRDGLSDSEELRIGSDPAKIDSDGDGLSDGEEVVHVDATTGLRDGGWDVAYAIVNNVPIITWMGSDPTKADTDGDGIIDMREKILGFSAYAKNSADIVAISGDVREGRSPLFTLDFNNTDLNSMVSNGRINDTTTCVNGCAVNTDVFASPGIRLAGTQQLNAGVSSKLFLTQQFTVSARIFAQRNISPNDYYDAIVTQAGVFALTRKDDGTISVELTTDVGRTQIDTNYVVAPQRVATVTVTYDGSVAIVYVNDREVSRAIVTGRMYDSDDSNNDIRIGGWQTSRGIHRCQANETACSNYETGTSWQGSLDDINIFAVALTPQDIVQLSSGTFQSNNDLIVRPGDSVVVSSTLKSKLLNRDMQGNTTISAESSNYRIAPSAPTGFALAHNAALDGDSVFMIPGGIDDTQITTTFQLGCIYPHAELCLKLDETAGTTTSHFTDLSSQTRHITCVNTLCAHYVDGAWKFTKDSNQANYSILLNTGVGNSISNRDFTVAFWYKPTEALTGKRTFLSNGKSGQNAFGLYAINTNSPGQEDLNKGIVPVIQIGNAQIKATTGIPYVGSSGNNWTHLAFRVRVVRSFVENNVNKLEITRQIFVNGVNVSLDSDNSAIIPAPSEAFGTLILGNDTNNTVTGTTGNNNYALGFLRDIQVYSNALNHQQIRAIASNCDDPWLISCTASGAVRTDTAEYAQANNITLTCASSCTNSFRYNDGVATLLHQREFSVLMKFSLSSTANQNLWSTNSTSSSNQIVLDVYNGQLRFRYAGNTATIATALSTSVNYVVAASVEGTTVRLHLFRSAGSMESATTSVSALAIAPQDPISVGDSNTTISDLRLYQHAVDLRNEQAYALYAFDGQFSADMATIPQTDVVSMRNTSTVKVISSDANFEKFPLDDSCAIESTRVCLPFMDSNNTAYQGVTALAANGTASLGINGNISDVLTVANTGNQPWYEIDLRSIQAIRTVRIWADTDNPLNNAEISLSTTSFANETSVANIHSRALVWKTVLCGDQSDNCAPNTTPAIINANFTKSDGTAVMARYVHIRVVSTSRRSLVLREIEVNPTDVNNQLPAGTLLQISPCGTTCPSINAAAARFTGTSTSVPLTTSAGGVFTDSRNMTFMGWFKFDSNSATILWNPNTDKGLSIGLNNGKPYIQMPTGRYITTTTIDSNRWYHLAFVKNASQIAIYINSYNVPIAYSAFGGTYGTNTYRIGGNTNFNGYISGLQINDAALSTEEIRLAYQRRMQDMHVSFDVPAQTQIYGDTTNTSLRLSCLNACPQSGIQGRNNNAVRFSGSQGLTLNTDANTHIGYAVNTLGRYTVSFWVRPTYYTQWIMGRNPSLYPSSAPTLNLYLAPSGVLEMRRLTDSTRNTYSSLVSSNAISLQQWSHILYSFDASTKVETLAVNGVIVTKTSDSSKVFRDLTLGDRFVGDIDEFDWRTEVISSQPDINALIAQTPHWNIHFDETLDALSPKLNQGVAVSPTVHRAYSAIPDSTTRWGIDRHAVSASCIATNSNGSCPAFGISGLASTAVNFDGHTTILMVKSPNTVINDMQNGGTVQITLRPDADVTHTQTVLRYGNATQSMLDVKITPDYYIVVHAGSYTYTSTTSIAAGWNQIAFTYSANGFSYIQNGLSNTDQTITRTVTLPVVTPIADATLTIGGRVSVGNVVDAFRGGIDEIMFMPTRIPMRAAFVNARQLLAMATSQKTIADVTVDADVATLGVEIPRYVPKLATNFLINAQDPTSYVDKVYTTIVSPINRNQKSTIQSPTCIDDINTHAITFCPTFNTTFSNYVEGRYTIQVDAYDIVNNHSVYTTTTLLDDTPPVASIVALPPGSSVYTVTRDLATNAPLIHLNVRVTDPNLRNSNNAAGSGVKEVKLKVYDISGRLITMLPQIATPLQSDPNVWHTVVALPFSNPTGFYKVSAITTDNMNNTNPSELVVAGDTNPIEVDGAPPHDIGVYPSSLIPNLYMVSNRQAATGFVSDAAEGRPALQNKLRVRLDFESDNEQTTVFANRGEPRFTAMCDTCPFVREDNTLNAQRVALFNITGNKQAIRVVNGSDVITGTYTVALLAKISDTGTLIGSGIASNPRLRLVVERDASYTPSAKKFTLKSIRGNTILKSTLKLDSDRWYYVVFSESNDTLTLSVGTQLTAMSTTTTPTVGDVAMSTPDLLIGAIASANTGLFIEDGFRGSIDDVLISSMLIDPVELVGRNVAFGSGVASHQTRLAIQNDGYAMRDTVSQSVRYYSTIAQANFPVLDSVNGIQSDICNGGYTRAPLTCPTIGDGFAGNSIVIARESDGVWLAPQMTSGITDTLSIGMRVRVDDTTQTGRIASIMSTNPDNTALMVHTGYEQQNQKIVISVADSDGTVMYEHHIPVTADSGGNWYHIGITSARINNQTSISAYLNGRIVFEFADTDLRWQNPTVRIGANENDGAVGVRVDDIGYFASTLNDADMAYLDRGLHEVVYLPFDNTQVLDALRENDASVYHHELTYQAGGSGFDIVNGTVGSGALQFDGDDSATLVDHDGLTVPYNDRPWSFAAWIKPRSANGQIMSGVLNGYTYQLDFVANKLHFKMGNYEITSQSTYMLPNAMQALAVVYDGTNASMYLDQQLVPVNVVEAPISATPSTNLVAGIASTLSSVDGQNQAWFATDGNADQLVADGSVARTTVSNNPSWSIDLGTVQRIDSIDIYPATDCCNDIQQLQIQLLGASYQQVVWEYNNPDTTIINKKLHLVLPPGTSARGIRLQIPTTLGQTAQLALAEVVVNQSAHVVFGTQYDGLLDDVRIYQHALTSDEIRLLATAGWHQSTLAPSLNGNTWTTSYPTDIETNAELQSISADNVGNHSYYKGEHPLWQGRVDTRSPQVVARESQDATTGLYHYTIAIDDRNLNPASVQTPCGQRLESSLVQHNSLAYISQNSAVDGTLREPTSLRGACEYGAIADIINAQTQAVSTTTVIAAGSRYHYLAQPQSIAVIDAHSPDSLIRASVPVSGTVRSILVTKDQNTIVAVTQVGGSIPKLIINTFDISTTPDAPVFLGKLEIPTSAGVVDVTLANNDTQLIILTNESRQRLLNIMLTNLSSPIQNLSKDIVSGSIGYSLTASYNIVALAQGNQGIAFYTIDENSTLQLAQILQTTGYVHTVTANDLYLYAIVDDESMRDGIAPTSVNALATYKFIDTVIAGQATLTPNIEPLNTYVHTSLSDDLYSINAYHITQVIPYIDDDIMILSALATTSGCGGTCQRISIINTNTLTPTLHTETQFSGRASAIARAKNDVIALLQNANGTQTQLSSYLVSDRRWDATACDRAGNCTVQPAITSASSQLVRSAPLQASAFLLNATTSYTRTANLDFRFRADAPTGIISMTLLIDNQPSLDYVPTTDSDNPSAPVSVEHSFTLPTITTGRHTAQLVFQTADSPPRIVVSPHYSFVVDTQVPTISIRNSIVGVAHLINDYIEVNARIVDDGELLSYRVVNTASADIYPFTSVITQETTSAGTQQVVLLSIYVPRGSLKQPIIAIRITAQDKAGRVTSRPFSVQVDADAPQLVNPQMSALINGKSTVLAAGSTITPTTSLDLNANWSQMSDLSTITLRQLEYTVTTVDGSVPYETLLTSPVLRTPALTIAEAARIQTGIRTGDSLDNYAVTALPDVYIDSALTPDYTLFNDTESVYRGWLNNGCAVMGTDERTIMRYDGQQFATTWDAQALRFNWQGANWDIDGDLFIYIDSKAGGTVTAFRPEKYTHDLTAQQQDGESFMVLPSNIAGRVTTQRSAAQTLTDWRTQLFKAQNNRSTATVEGADYVMYVGDTKQISLWSWNQADDAWELVDAIPQYRYDSDNNIENTDIRLLFRDIGYNPNTPLGIVAFATPETLFMPWASFPTSNPSRNGMYGDKIVVVPFINGYAWPNLNAGVCPSRSAIIPNTTQIQASLVSTPGGANTRSVADSFANTEPDAIQAAIDETSTLCAVLTSDPWCQAIDTLQTTAMAGSSLLAGLRNINIRDQAPVLGNNAVVTYTLTIANTSAAATTPMYGIAQTYGGVWFTSTNNANIVGGGNYTYHSVSDAVLRDFLFLQIPAIPAGQSISIQLRGVVDIDKAQSFPADRIATGDIAKVEVRLTDRNPQPTPTTTRTIEWLNSAIRIDTQAPSQVIPTANTALQVGNNTLTGIVVDESAVRSVDVEYSYNGSGTVRRQTCAVTSSKQWSCGVSIPSGTTTLKYRLRATDIYGLVSLWGSYYVTPIDTDKPSFAFDSLTNTLVQSSLVGGSTITLQGAISDSTSLGSLTICDDSAVECDTVSATTTNSTTQSYTTSNMTQTAITAKPCKELDFSSYTVYPLTQSVPSTARVSTVDVEVRIAHDSAQNIDLWLRSPSGTRVALVNSTRAPMLNLVAHFSDENTILTSSLPVSSTTAATPTEVHPDGTLATFIGEPVNGAWAVLACNRTTSPIGTFVSSTLHITSQTPPHNTNSSWNYALPNISELDGVVRSYSIWARDGAGNVGPIRRIRLKIDTVAPILSITPRGDNNTVQTSEFTLYSGTLIESSTQLPELYAKIYKDNVLYRTVPIVLTTASNSGLQIQRYLSGQSAKVYTWNLPFDPVAYDKGIYRVQFYTTDVLGNSYVSSVYVFDNPAQGIPEYVSTDRKPPHTTNTTQVQVAINSHYDATTVDIALVPDMPESANYTTTIGTWSYNNPSDVVSRPELTALHGQQIQQIAASTYVGAILQTDGTVTLWPFAAGSVISTGVTLKNISQIALADDLTSADTRLIALGNDGRIAQMITDTVTYPLGNTTAVQIDAGRTHNVALLNTGQVLTWQTDSEGTTTSAISTTTHITQVAAGDGFTVTLNDAGAVAAWGKNDRAQITLPADINSSSFAPIVSIVTGYAHTVALRSDGTVVAWGDDTFGQSSVPATLTDVVYISAGAYNSAAVQSDGTVVVWGRNRITAPASVNLIAFGSQHTIMEWLPRYYEEHAAIPAAGYVQTASVIFKGTQPGRRYRYTVMARNTVGKVIASGVFFSGASRSNIYVPYVTSGSEPVAPVGIR